MHNVLNSLFIDVYCLVERTSLFLSPKVEIFLSCSKAFRHTYCGKPLFLDKLRYLMVTEVPKIKKRRRLPACEGSLWQRHVQ